MPDVPADTSDAPAGTSDASAAAQTDTDDSRSDDARPTILIDTEEHRVISETIDALAADDNIFHRGCILVRVLREDHPNDGVIRSDGSPTIQVLPSANLRERMTRCASFVKYNSKGDEVPAHPAAWLVSAVDARGEWPALRHLAGVSDCPVLRPDGSVWQTNGYDPRTGVLFESRQAFPLVHPEVNIDDAVVAVDELTEVVCDFRFESPEHRAAWLAALLTPLARFAFEGPSPLFLVDANVRGAGKGLLAQTIGRIVLGREMPVSSYSHEPNEMRKRITAISIAGDRMVLLDNLEGAFGNDALDRALTSTRWKDRVLGRSGEIDLPLMCVWYATGNNVAVAADTTRRVIHIRLDVLEERPEDRTGFRHPDLLAWIAQNRPKLLTSALTILSAYCKAGRPSQGLSSYGSFEGWSNLVRQAVVWAGLPEPSAPSEERKRREATSFLCYVDALGRYADFHALRHTTGTLLALGGVNPKTAQTLMRHSDINLTMSLYTHTLAGQEAAAIASLPNLDTAPTKQQPKPTNNTTDTTNAATTGATTTPATDTNTNATNTTSATNTTTSVNVTDTTDTPTNTNNATTATVKTDATATGTNNAAAAGLNGMTSATNDAPASSDKVLVTTTNDMTTTTNDVAPPTTTVPISTENTAATADNTPVTTDTAPAKTIEENAREHSPKTPENSSENSPPTSPSPCRVFGNNSGEPAHSGILEENTKTAENLMKTSVFCGKIDQLTAGTAPRFTESQKPSGITRITGLRRRLQERNNCFEVPHDNFPLNP